MNLVDTSVWIEFLRGTPTRATAFLRANVGIDAATTEPVLMELLAGARPGEHTERMERLLLSQRWYQVAPGLDYRGAVAVYHATRSTGHSPRSLTDCLIAAIALRKAATIVHRDADYEYIAAATGLKVLDLRE